MLRKPALIDKYIPQFDVRDYRETRVSADRQVAYAALRSMDLKRSRIVRLLFAIRTLPSRFRASPPPSNPPTSLLDETLALGWRILEEDPGRELVVGAVTRPWEPVVRFRGLPESEFLECSEPGFTKVAWSLVARPAGPSATTIATETRVVATDPISRKRFRRYWSMVSPGIRLIRILSLRVIKRDLERHAAASALSSGRASA